MGTSLLLAACTREEPVRVGFVGGLSGRVADLGVAGRNGVMLAIEQRNAAGGDNGRPIELIVRDDEQSPEAARKAAEALLSRKVDVIIGPMTSSMAVAMTPLIDGSQTVLLSPTVTTNALTGKDDNFFRVISGTREYANKNARYQFEKLNRRKIAAIYDLSNKAYAESWLQDFRTAFEELGGKVIEVKTFRSGNDVVFSGLARELLAAGPDGVLIITNAVDAALICQQVRNLAPRMPIAMSEWASTERFIKLGGKATEGVLVAQFLDRNNTSERYLAFLQAYRDRFGQDPGFAGLAAYDAALVALEGLSLRSPEETLKETLLRQKIFQGVQQPIEIDRFGDAYRKTFMTEIRDGNYVTLE